MTHSIRDVIEARKMMIDEKTPEAATNGAPKVKPDGRIGTLEKKVELLEGQLTQVRWCFAELVYKIKLAAAEQMLNNPDVKKKLLDEMMARMQQ